MTSAMLSQKIEDSLSPLRPPIVRLSLLAACLALDFEESQLVNWSSLHGEEDLILLAGTILTTYDSQWARFICCLFVLTNLAHIWMGLIRGHMSHN